ncbi:unnamed protein product [Larinioides sclopetarius]|uniref:Uncharacterized protein n=1 Tax=Larinioides sclopetarius TaxID=280406 RepID=A0AAV2APP6_9ARAC
MPIRMPQHDEIMDTGEVVEDLHSSMGHQFRFAFSVTGLVDGEPYTFKQDIDTNCGTLSTSWTLEFTFKQAPGCSIASCAIIAKRTDSMNATVKASIEMSYSYLEYPCHELQQLYTNEYEPGQEVQEFCEDILPFPEESEMYLAGGITVGVLLCVECCEPK